MLFSELTGTKKSFYNVATITTLIVLFFSLIFVWGDVISIYRYASSNFEGVKSIGLNYFIYDGWKNVSDIANQYDNPMITTFLYGSLVISILAFIATVVIVYVYGIKGIIKGLKALTNHKTTNIFKNGVIVSLTLLAYYCIANMFSFHAYGPAVLNGDYEISIIESWGGAGYGFFCWIGMTIVIVSLIVIKFDSKKVTISVRNILIGISFLFLLSLAKTALTNCFGYKVIHNSKVPLNLINSFVLLFGVELEVETAAFVTLTTLFVLAVAIVSILLLVELLKHHFFEKELNKKKIIILSVILGVASLISMIVSNFASLKLVEDLETLFFVDFVSNNNVASLFGSSLVIIVLTVTSSCLNEKDDDEQKLIENELN